MKISWTQGPLVHISLVMLKCLKGYRFYRPTHNTRIVESRNEKFIENDVASGSDLTQGIGLGWLITYIVGRIAAANNTPFAPSISLNAVILATVFSTAVGLFFGLYPANRAAGLEPVEALRSE